jgi:GNAT superfamily N-acetyltransferase
MNPGHVKGIYQAFKSWNKTLRQYEHYFSENQQGIRVTLVAELEGRVVGYGNLLKDSYYRPFKDGGIPEINDLNVVTDLQGQGIGRELIKELEALARAQGHAVIGIGVGLGSDYAKAQRLYPRLGYESDGRGNQVTEWGDETHLVKQLGH